MAPSAGWGNRGSVGTATRFRFQCSQSKFQCSRFQDSRFRCPPPSSCPLWPLKTGRTVPAEKAARTAGPRRITLRRPPPYAGQGPRFKAQGPRSRSKVQGSRFKVQVQGSRFKVQGSRSKVQGPRSKVQGPRSKVHGPGSRSKAKVQGSNPISSAPNGTRRLLDLGQLEIEP